MLRRNLGNQMVFDKIFKPITDKSSNEDLSTASPADTHSPQSQDLEDLKMKLHRLEQEKIQREREVEEKMQKYQ